MENRWKRVFNNYNNSLGGIAFGNFVNIGSLFTQDPFLLNQRLKSLRTNPRFLKREEIENALLEPEYNELALRTATESMIYLAYPLYRLVYLYEGILTYRSYIQPLYVDSSKMNSRRFKSDWAFIDRWHKKLNPKHQFRRIVGEVLPEGKVAYYLRQGYNTTTGKESVDYVYFQRLPSNFYKIIKHSTNSYAVIAFDFSYFWQAGTSVGQFPPIFAQYYEELMSVTEIRSNRQWINIEKTPKDVVVEYNHETLTWAYWKELPDDRCFVFSFTESDDLQISPFSSLLLQAQDLSSYALLQQQLLTVPLYSMILGEIPTNKDNKTGSHTDDYILSPDAVDLFEGKVNSVMPPGTVFSMVPSINNTLHHFQEIPNANKIYNIGLQQMINTSGASTVMTTTEKPSVAQVNAGKTIEKRYIDRMYEQFAWAINIILNDMYEKGDLKFEWYFRIFGDSFSEKEEIGNLEKSLSLGQIEFLPDYLAYRDKSLMDAVTSAEWVECSGIYDKFRPLVNSYTSSNTSVSDIKEKVGRKPVDESNIESDATAASIDSGQNTSEMRYSNGNVKYRCVCGKVVNTLGDYFPFCSDECRDNFLDYIEEHSDNE